MNSLIYISEIIVNQVKSDVNEIVNETLNNAENKTGNVNERPKATPEGRFVAYVSLIVMALLPIWIGAFKSVKAHQDQKEKSLVSGEKPETLTHKDAAMFPFIASGALLGLYIFFKLFSKEYVNLLLTGYFFVLGVLALADNIYPLLVKFLPAAFPVIPYHLLFVQGEKEALIDYHFDTRTIAAHILSTVFGGWYLWNKHWVVNNLFGLAFAVKGVELLHLNSVLTGCILLGGLFIYDIFWVFGTDVMVTVAKSFEAPIKLIFPQDFLENAFFGKNFAMLGLGDIVIPGIFLALLLRFDNSLNRKSYFYFYTSFIAYILGLVLTIVVMTVFNHAQPALLYLVPFCISFPLFFALIRGDLKTMFAYKDHEEEEEETSADKSEQSDTKKTK